MTEVIKEYECESCGNFEIWQDSSEMLEKCPECGGDVERLISLPLISKLDEPRTIGTQIERNNKRNPLTREKMLGSEADFQRKAEQRAKNRKINSMTDQQKNEYIKTGKMP
jgi:putative FmdB family regulatory protein